MAFCCCEQDSEFWYMGNSIDTKVYHTPVFWYCPAFGPAGQQAPTKTPIIEEELKEFKIINRWAEYKGNWINPLGLWNEAYTSGNIIPEQLYGIWSRELTDQVPGITLSVGGGFVPVAPRLDLYNKTEIRASGILWRQNVSNRCLSTCPPPNPECINPTDPIIKQLCDIGDLENGRRVANIYFPIGSTMNPWETSPITDSTNQFPPPFEKWKRFVYTCLQNGSGTGDQNPELVWCPSGICRTAVCEQPGLSYCCETAWNSECAQAARNSIKCTYNGKDQGKAQHYLSPVGLTGPWPHFQPRVHHKTTEPIFTPARLFKTCDELCDTFKWQQEIDCTEKSYFRINKDIFTIEASQK